MHAFMEKKYYLSYQSSATVWVPKIKVQQLSEYQLVSFYPCAIVIQIDDDCSNRFCLIGWAVSITFNV